MHDFELEVNDAFFGAFEYSIVKKGELTARLSLDKQDNLLVLMFHIQGAVELTCDRCLETFMHPLNIREQQLVKISDEAGDREEEVSYISRNEYELNVAPFIYEFIHLALPIISVHPDDERGQSTCNPDTLAALDRLRVREGNKRPPEDQTDPRWEALKKFKRN